MPKSRSDQAIQKLATNVATSVHAKAAQVVLSLRGAETDRVSDTATAIAESVTAAAQAAAVTVEAAAAAAAAALAVQAAAAAVVAAEVEESVASLVRAAAADAQAATTAAAVAVETAVRVAALTIRLAERTALEAARALATEKAIARDLRAALNDKEALLKEVHHRVKNNLQVITSLLRLERGRSSIDDTKAVLGEMQARIRAMALLHESLYRSGTFASVDLGRYLRQLSTQTFQALAT